MLDIGKVVGYYVQYLSITNLSTRVIHYSIPLRTNAATKGEASTTQAARAAKAKNIATMVFKFLQGYSTPATYKLVAFSRFYNILSGRKAATTASYAETLVFDTSINLITIIYLPSAPPPFRRHQTGTVTLNVPINTTMLSVGFPSILTPWA